MKIRYGIRETKEGNKFFLLLGAGWGKRCYIIWLLGLQIELNFNQPK